MITQRKKIVARLLHLGYVLKASRSKKYLTFSHPGQENDLFVGKSGALRTGKTSSGSFSVSEAARKRVVAHGERHLKEKDSVFEERVDHALTGATPPSVSLQ